MCELLTLKYDNNVVCSNIDDVDKTMDEINEQTENMKQIQEALSTPIGTAADIDEVKFEIRILCSFLLSFRTL